jgi:uncharacterized RDD family membrane protein YckC
MFPIITLIAVAVIYSLAIFTELFFPGNHVFEACSITLPPIATFIIGYFFGSNKNSL